MPPLDQSYYNGSETTTASISMTPNHRPIISLSTTTTSSSLKPLSYEQQQYHVTNIDENDASSVHNYSYEHNNQQQQPPVIFKSTLTKNSLVETDVRYIQAYYLQSSRRLGIPTAPLR